MGLFTGKAWEIGGRDKRGQEPVQELMEQEEGFVTRVSRRQRYREKIWKEDQDRYMKLLFLKIYLFIYSERAKETQAEGEAGSMQEARGGT